MQQTAAVARRPGLFSQPWASHPTGRYVTLGLVNPHVSRDPLVAKRLALAGP